ncbi:glycosyltransferase family 2 protein [Rhabdaerophilum sp. SD176]|uniref:glycosyltransferase family 2 protein n=1 Tax=Rhabdaerophilum sp. SD176 TaxID=2983548 RepID=UPI0024E036FB|nr:glycosyltransferase family 2 protein [Rhabdaerophilum sp. SD176]
MDQSDSTAGDTEAATAVLPLISVVVPVRNEEGNVAPLLAEIVAALESGPAFEVLFVDDGSTDETPTILANLRGSYPQLRQLRHARSGGQSAAIRSGVRFAHGTYIATLDGDGQNNPAFIPQMIRLLQEGEGAVGIVQGQRVGRKDTPFKRWQSRQANRIRGAILKDGTRDTGCGLKAFPREVYLALPYFDAIHRFMPALVKREGYAVAHLDVVDRPRGSGVSNYGFWGRLRVGVLDLAGVWWLIKRKRPTPPVVEVGAAPGA